MSGIMPAHLTYYLVPCFGLNNSASVIHCSNAWNVRLESTPIEAATPVNMYCCRLSALNPANLYSCIIPPLPVNRYEANRDFSIFESHNVFGIHPLRPYANLYTEKSRPRRHCAVHPVCVWESNRKIDKFCALLIQSMLVNRPKHSKTRWKLLHHRVKMKGYSLEQHGTTTNGRK